MKEIQFWENATCRLLCHMCFYKAKNKISLICHCLIKHKTDGNFIAYCPITPCMDSTTSWNAFKIHFHVKTQTFTSNRTFSLDNLQIVHIAYHGANLDEVPDFLDNMSDDDYLNEGTTFRHKDENHNFNDLMVLSKYFMSLEADHKMSKNSLKSVAASNKHLMATVVAKSTRTIEKLLRNLHLITENDINDMVKDFNFEMCEEVLKSADVFLSEYQRQSVYTKLCQLVDPLSVISG